MKILETIDLNKSYGKGEAEVKALSHADICIKNGEFVAIVGTSGSGQCRQLSKILMKKLLQISNHVCYIAKKMV